MSFVTFTSGEKLASADLNGNFSAVLDAQVFNEDYTPLVTGIASTFSTAFHFVPGTLRVHQAGARVRRNTGTTHFVENLDGNGNGVSFTLSPTPSAGVEVISDYQKSSVDL